VGKYFPTFLTSFIFVECIISLCAKPLFMSWHFVHGNSILHVIAARQVVEHLTYEFEIHWSVSSIVDQYPCVVFHSLSIFLHKIQSW